MSSDNTDAESRLIRCEATLSTIDDTALVRLPESTSKQLPSRGQVAVRATLEGHPFQTVLEPDGRRGHWVRVDAPLQQAVGIEPGDTAELTLQVVANWPEPDVPEDLAAALAAAPATIRDLWDDITPMARWEWVRWVKATRNPATQQRRIDVTLSKMDHGKRRPCCFDLSSCTDPELARSGKLREPS
ncbi:MAG: YdeI/OmpD-associated family protein [Ornithinimicrobium sp.]